MNHERPRRVERYTAAYADLCQALDRFPKDMWQYRAAPDGWTIHEIIVHIADSEANSYARLRRLIAEPGQAVMAYDENAWARALDYHAQSPSDALELFRWLRGNSARLLARQPEGVWTHAIYHPENGVMTMDDWLAVYARHVTDHVAQMAAIHAAWQARTV
jgi:hypothetical protein